MKSADVVNITTKHGAKYAIKQVCADPARFIAFSDGPVEDGPLHRDARSLPEAMAVVATVVEAGEKTISFVKSALVGGSRA